jgi:hypothetical protein
MNEGRTGQETTVKSEFATHFRGERRDCGCMLRAVLPLHEQSAAHRDPGSPVANGSARLKASDIETRETREEGGAT